MNDLLYEIILSCKNADEMAFNLVDDKILGVEILDETTTKIYLDKNSNLEEFISNLKENGFELQKINEIKNENWTIKCKDFYVPIEEKKLFITPVIDGEKTILRNDLINIKIYPGMAFGTGHHETTKGILSLIQEDEIKKINVKNILDVGAGTCILSIAGVLLFEANALAFDNDEATIENANKNILLNNLEDKIKFFCGTIEDVQEENFDLILANIYAEVLIQIFDKIREKASENSYTILSGIEKEKANLVEKTYEKSFKLVKKITDGNWVSMLLKKIK